MMSYLFVLLCSCSYVLQQRQSAREDQDTIRLLNAARLKGEMDEAEIRRKDVRLRDMGKRLEAREAEIERLRRERDDAGREVQETRASEAPKMSMFVFRAN